jgi:hypothetical protein
MSQLTEWAFSGTSYAKKDTPFRFGKKNSDHSLLIELTETTTRFVCSIRIQIQNGSPNRNKKIDIYLERITCKITMSKNLCLSAGLFSFRSRDSLPYPQKELSALSRAAARLSALSSFFQAAVRRHSKKIKRKTSKTQPIEAPRTRCEFVCSAYGKIYTNSIKQAERGKKHAP